MLVSTSLMNVSGGESDITSILSERISENLFLGGFNSIFIKDETSVTDVIDSALFMGAFFVIEIIYIDSDTVKNLCLRAYSSWDNALIGEEKNSFANFSDEAFLTSGSTLLPLLKNHLDTDEARDLASRLNMFFREEQEKESSTGPEEITLDEPSASEQEEQVAVEERQTPEPPPLPAAGERVWNRGDDILLSLDSGVFVSTFDAADYFSSASSLSVRSLYRYAFPGFLLNGGGLFQYTGFNACGIQNESRTTLLALGGELGIEPRLKGRFRIYLNAEFGGSLLIMETEEQGVLAKAVPFVSGGIGSGLFLTEHWCCSLAVNYTLFMEESVLISGFVPQLGVIYLM